MIGFIGYGSMGKMLIKGFLQAGILRSEEMIITRADKNKLPQVAEDFPGIQLAETPAEVVKYAETVFICVKPLQVKGIVDDISSNVSANTHIVITTNLVMLEQVQRLLPCALTKIMPTVTSEAGAGYTLVCHGAKVDKATTESLDTLLKSVGGVRLIAEEQMGFASELTACGPGLFAGLFQEFVTAGVRAGGMSEEEVVDMVVQTLYGTAKLLAEQGMSLTEIMGRVATKNGITEQGLLALKTGLPAVFDEMFLKTKEKRKAVADAIEKDFEQPGAWQMKIDIRKALQDDLDAAEQIIKEATEKLDSEGIRQWDELYPNREILSSDIDSGGMHILLQDGSPSAIIVLNEEQYPAYQTVVWKHHGKILVVHRLCVKPDCQGRGLAKRMMIFAEEYAKEHGYAAIRLDAFTLNPPALRLYELMGYEKAGIVSFRKGDFYCFEKKLK